MKVSIGADAVITATDEAAAGDVAGTAPWMDVNGEGDWQLFASFSSSHRLLASKPFIDREKPFNLY
jgi:hypothetical protein